METKKIVILSVALLVIVGSATSIFKQCRRPVKPDTTLLLRLAAILDEETAKLIQNRGQVVIVGTDEPWSKHVIPALERSLRKHGDALTVAVERIKPPVSKGTEDVGLPADELNRILQKYPDAAAMVSLVGPPLLRDRNPTQKLPKVAVYSSLATGIRSLLEEGLIQVAVIPRRSPIPQGASRANPGRQDAYYQVITPDTIPLLPFEPPIPPTPPMPK